MLTLMFFNSIGRCEIYIMQYKDRYLIARDDFNLVIYYYKLKVKYL